MSHAELEPWQRPEQRTYFQPSQTTYYETTRRENRGGGALIAGAFGVVGANALLGWAAWSAHQACIHGNAHSVVAEAIVGATAVGSGAFAVRGFASGTESGSWAGALLSPVSLVLTGFGVLLWAPGWSASMVGALMVGTLNAGLAVVGIKLKREERRLNHEAGMQHDAIAGDLQKNYDAQQAKTERKSLKYRAWFHVGRDADGRADRTEYALHLRHPEIVAAPERYGDNRPNRELPASRQPRAITSGAERVDDWMALADVLDEHVETR